MRTLTIMLCMTPFAAWPAEAIVAVAANFLPVLEEIRDGFESTSSHTLRIVSGSTGKLYAQIVNGAPYDVFLAADVERPRRLETSGPGVRGTRFTYAVGRLVAWSSRPGIISDDVGTTLRQDDVRRVSIANPRLAPYGIAARQALDATGLADATVPKVVMGENVVHAFTMAATGNTDVGLVALSTVLTSEAGARGRFVEIPASLYQPIRQDGLLLEHGRSNDAALAFIRYLKSDEVQRRLAAFGYRASRS